MPLSLQIQLGSLLNLNIKLLRYNLTMRVTWNVINTSELSLGGSMGHQGSSWVLFTCLFYHFFAKLNILATWGKKWYFGYFWTHFGLLPDWKGENAWNKKFHQVKTYQYGGLWLFPFQSGKASKGHYICEKETRRQTDRDSLNLYIFVFALDNVSVIDIAHSWCNCHCRETHKFPYKTYLAMGSTSNEKI